MITILLFKSILLYFVQTYFKKYVGNVCIAKKYVSLYRSQKITGLWDKNIER